MGQGRPERKGRKKGLPFRAENADGAAAAAVYSPSCVVVVAGGDGENTASCS